MTAIRAGDHATLTRIPGIGKKTAERVVLELKDKLDDMAVAPAAAGAVALWARRRDDVLSRDGEPGLCAADGGEGD